MIKNKNICQSCGRSIYRISEFGTHKDGSINTDYCFHCYQEGAHTDQNISLEQKIARNIKLAAKMGISRAKALKEANAVLPNLKRWRRFKTKGQEDIAQ